MIRVKICGITSVDDALAAAAAGADAVGLVFVPASSRYVDLDEAASISQALGPFINRVGLFMDAPAEHVEQVLAKVPLDTLQFHGHESPRYCRGFERPWIKAIAMGQADTPAWEDYSGALALLLDSHGGGKLGGSGQTFDWDRIPDISGHWILAGGLSADNVGEACRRLRPDAVDVSSGVEIRPGIKDHDAINAFIKAVRHA
jgi:phosphoribosylanthranilate isomerase